MLTSEEIFELEVSKLMESAARREEKARNQKALREIKRTGKLFRGPRKSSRQIALSNQERIAELNSEIEELAWRTISCVAVFHQSTCDCCQTSTKIFDSFRIKQTKGWGFRYLKLKHRDSNYPLETLFLSKSTPACWTCIEDQLPCDEI